MCTEYRGILLASTTIAISCISTVNCLPYFIRLYNSSTNTYQQDCDDDGEAAAGGRLLHLLQVGVIGLSFESHCREALTNVSYVSTYIHMFCSTTRSWMCVMS